ncbi:hypothetical protein E3P99_03003 [Wallemia hederae]|uniref:DUF1308 domain-containing protein n=1 Tax=Wallemia hederae TaxID=1540922 RepID=A0A4T0FJD7_9BASI|nr:hypothetical protein E3P99_03003 [Wallemia hederae]
MTSIAESIRIYKEIFEQSALFTSNDDRLLVIDNWLDVPNDWTCSGIEGYHRWRMLIRAELIAAEELLQTNDANEPLISSNLIAHWTCWMAIINPAVSKHPITAVNKYLMLPKRQGHKGKPKSVKVDVVADAGREWIRLSNIKLSSILAELTEIDSLITSSEDEADPVDQPMPVPFLLKLGHELSEASCRHIIHDQRPAIHLYLTRLTPQEIADSDSRVASQLETLSLYGIQVHFGIPTYDLKLSPKPPRQPLKPSSNINLDVSTIIAFISLTTHIHDPAEASLKPNNANEHVRAISNQLRQESSVCALFDLVRQTCDTDTLQFWTTQENKERTYSIMEKIGGASEKRRLDCIFDGGDFWQGSRYSDSPVPGFPVKIISDAGEDVATASFDDFVLRRAQKALSSDGNMGSAGKVTSHTLRTVIAGLERGWTTLTSNRQSIKALVQGWHTHLHNNSSIATFWLVEPRSLSEQMLERSDRQRKLEQPQDSNADSKQQTVNSK